PEQLREIEPHCNGRAAFKVYSTGICDYKAVSAQYARIIAEHEGDVRYNTRITALREDEQGTTISTTAGEFQCRTLINCCGLHSDRVAKLAGVDPQAKIVPFRGEYYELTPEKRYLCKHL